MQDLTTLIWILQALLRSAFSCSHTATPVHEGKCYCPDCGKGVIFRWVMTRCGGCHTRRETRYVFRHVFPVASFCPQCGESDVYSEYLEAPKYYQVTQAKLVVMEAEDIPGYGWWPKTKAWLNPTPRLLPILVQA